MTYGPAPANQNTGMATPNTSMSELSTSSRTTLPARTTPRTRQPTTVIPQDMSHNELSQCCMHVHQRTSQVCKPGELLALRKVKHPHNGKTSVSRLPLTKQDILSQYSGCFEGIGHFPGDPYKFHLKPDHKPARYAPRQVPVHLEAAFKEEIESLVKQGILEEVKEHTDWVNSYVIVEKDTGNHHSPNHTVKKKLRICLDSRDLNEALERQPYHTRSVDEIHSQITRYDCFYRSRLQERLLDGSSSSRFQETYLHGPTIWQIPMDSFTNGYSCGTGHFSVQAGCHLYWHGRCHRNC